MAVLKKKPGYGGRSVAEWMKRAMRDEVLLPNFQRSLVWRPQLAADYMMALLENRPTGTFLILEAANPLPFTCRYLQTSGVRERQPPAVSDTIRELVLDGQQRFTSLWGALTGQAEKRYFIRVKDLIGGDLAVTEVIWRAHSWSNPVKMYRENVIPVDILWEDGSDGNPAASADDLQEWCETAAGEHWTTLHKSVVEMQRRLVFEPELRFCLLGADTDRDTAVDIFINVNRSAVTLKKIDITVAIAEAEHGVDLRALVEQYIDDSDEVEHYFNPRPALAIPEVATWMLKVACLKVRNTSHPEGLPPRELNYPSAVDSLFGPARTGNGDEDTVSAIDRLTDDLDAALRFVAARGGATKRTLPSWPPVHVLAALQESLRELSPDLRACADKLLSAYVWRGFLTDRYTSLADARLLEDFRALRRYLEALADTQDPESARPLARSVPVFDTVEYPLPGVNKLRRAGWIGSASRLGKAVAAVTMAGNPLDWVTGEVLNPRRVRELEAQRKLVRRHVFPAAKFGDDLRDSVTLGLNGVLLRKSSPPLPLCDPGELLERVRQLAPSGAGELPELELRKRLHSHLVQWLAVRKDGGAPSYRYGEFLKSRASDIAMRAEQLTSL